jgi:putative flippase GtrA
MKQKLVQIIKTLWQKLLSHKEELWRYFVFGVLTTLVNVLIFQFLLKLSISYLIANLVALIAAKLFAYVTNKHFVFKTQTKGVRSTAREVLRFVFARGFTGLVDYFGLIFMVEALSLDPVLSKYFLQVIVIALNYILGKKMVFVQD